LSWGAPAASDSPARVIASWSGRDDDVARAGLAASWSYLSHLRGTGCPPHWSAVDDLDDAAETVLIPEVDFASLPELTDALVAREQDIRNVIGTIDGFRAYYLVRTADGPTTISVFDDQAGAEASTAAAAAYIRENMADVSPGAPQLTTGETVLSF
jgi:hypothetical protein